MTQTTPDDRQAAWLGAREAFGVPAAVLGAGFIGFGALAADAGYSLWATTLSTLVIWALPGQLVLNELYGLGTAPLAIILAVSLTAVRFLPMAVTLMPIVRAGRHGRTRLFLAAHFISMTSWAACMRRCDELPREQRLAYLLAFSVTCWAACLATGALGYFLGDWVSPAVRLGLVFLTPVYFCVILVGDARTPLARIALACGAMAGPLFHRVDPQWGLLAAGLVAGTLAYVLQRAWGRVRA